MIKEDLMNLLESEIMEEAQKSREDILSKMSPALKEAFLKFEDAYNNYLAVYLGERYGAKITVSEDKTKIMVDGVEMGYFQFEDWITQKEYELRDDSPSELEETLGSIFKKDSSFGKA